MRRFLAEKVIPAFAILTLLVLGMTARVHAQDSLEVQDVNVAYNFGQQITFQARLQSLAGISQASVLFRESDEAVTRVGTLALDPDGRAQFTYDTSLNVLPPFSNILFWFQAVLTDGRTRTSSIYNFRYDDNRFPWQQLSDGGVTVHWYEGDGAFGQAALDSARMGLGAIRQLLPSTATDTPLDVYIYSKAQDLQDALFLGGRPWMGGHADPSMGVAMAAIPPGEAQSIEMQTEIPHEMAHILLYRDMGAGYGRLPVWLNEGIASMVEGYPKADYANALSLASKNSSLIPLAGLCDSFPPDSGRAFLAYAESQSFASYLRDTYGSTGLAALIRAYADGLDCELGAARAVGLPLSQLDTRWRESVLGQNVAGAAFRALAPYLLVMVLALAIPLWGALKMVREKRKYERKSG